MVTAFSLIEPFFAWKQGPPRRFAESSRAKYEPLLVDFARWSGDRNLQELTTAVVASCAPCGPAAAGRG